MNGASIVYGLRRAGYTLGLSEAGNVRCVLPCGLQEAPELVERLREHKAEVVAILKRETEQSDAFPVGDDGVHEVIFETERDIFRWGIAAERGLISFTQKLRFAMDTGRCYIRFRSLLPIAWLQTGIDATANEMYHDQLERVQEVEKQLLTSVDTPALPRLITEYEVMLERLRRLYVAAHGA